MQCNSRVPVMWQNPGTISVWLNTVFFAFTRIFCGDQTAPPLHLHRTECSRMNDQDFSLHLSPKVSVAPTLSGPEREAPISKARVRCLLSFSESSLWIRNRGISFLLGKLVGFARKERNAHHSGDTHTHTHSLYL